jgi:hypothetical protein
MNALKGKDLIFISRIKKDGSGTEDISGEDMSFEDDELFAINGLSLTAGTYIAARMSVYVVKIKPKNIEDFPKKSINRFLIENGYANNNEEITIEKMVQLVDDWQEEISKLK